MKSSTFDFWSMATYKGKGKKGTVTTAIRTSGLDSPFRTIRGLKEQAYQTWTALREAIESADLDSLEIPILLPTTDLSFKQCMRQFGDLRRKLTWENAWCALYARIITEGAEDNVQLIQVTFGANAQSEGWLHLMPQVLDNFLEAPNARQSIANGLERIYRAQEGFPKELASFAAALSSSLSWNQSQETVHKEVMGASLQEG